jgi:hypothetical protein
MWRALANVRIKEALILTAALLAVGCAERAVRPAPDAPPLPGARNAASADVAGVRLRVESSAWHGTPPNLTRAVVPLRVSIENRSNHLLRVRYRDFAFRGPVLDYYPLPPQKLVDRDVTVKSDPLLLPRAVGPGFHVPLAHYPNAPDSLFWDLPWEANPEFYRRQYAKWTVSLPTVDMIDQSLPEGVLDRGAQVDGFLYFEHFRSAAHRLRFTVELIDARTGLTFGTLSVPFVH